MKTFEEKVDYWLKQSGLDVKDTARDLFLAHEDKINVYENEKGVIAFMVTPDFRGDLCLIEVMFFVKPEHRSLRVCNKFLEKLEEYASIYKCKHIKLGANFGYNDEGFLKYLVRKGYKYDSVSKEI